MKKKRLIALTIIVILLIAPVLASVLPASPALALTFTSRPNADGDTNEYTPSAGNNWENVDEVVVDDDVTYNYTPAVSGWYTDLYNLPSPTVGIINSITVYAIVRGALAFPNGIHGVVAIKTDGTIYIGDDNVLYNVYGQIDETWATNPATEVAWTLSDLEDLQIGVKLTTAYDGFANYSSRITQSWVVVDYDAMSSPTITAQAASNIGNTTARLNGTIDDDGGGEVEVRWGYGKVSQIPANFNLYTSHYPAWDAWTGSYTTGQNPYYDASGLDANDTYFYRFQARNAEGTIVTSDEITFDTLAAVGNPSNFIAYPGTTTVSLSWTKGTGSTNSEVRYSISAYPTLETEGIQVYFGTSSSTTHIGLTIGETYYYSVWGEDATVYSAAYDTALATTSGASAAADDLETPTTPTRWLSAPDYTNLSGLPIIYDTVNNTAIALDMPEETMWMLLALLGAVGFGIALYIVSGHKMMIGTIALILALTFGWAIKIVPMWIPILSILMVVALKVSHREVET